MTYREDIPFFNDLPPKAEKAAARLWDAVKSPDYNGARAYNDFVQDCAFQKIDPPPRGVVRRWVAGVQANLIKRPGGPAPKPAAPIVELADVLVADPAGGEPVRPAVATSIDPETREVAVTVHVDTAQEASPGASLSAIVDAFEPVSVIPAAIDLVLVEESSDKALFRLRDRMVEEALQSILQDARARARRLVAGRLREMADQMEIGGGRMMAIFKLDVPFSAASYLSDHDSRSIVARYMHARTANRALKMLRMHRVLLEAKISLLGFFEAIWAKQGLVVCGAAERFFSIGAGVQSERDAFKELSLSIKLIKLRHFFLQGAYLLSKKRTSLYLRESRLLELAISIRELRKLIPEGFNGTVNQLLCLRFSGGRNFLDVFGDIRRGLEEPEGRSGCGNNLDNSHSSLRVRPMG